MASAGAIPMTRLGGKAFNHSANQGAEAEYDRLRDLAHKEAAKRSSCFDRAHQAYESGNGAEAHALSEEGKKHAAKMDEYNKQASDYIFRENNASGRVGEDTIDLHGQYVEEAERILEDRIRAEQQRGSRGLHVIVGKGNHSYNHIQKIKPRVEQVCQELGLQYATEENAGRMYINLQGGQALMPSPPIGSGYTHGNGDHHGNNQGGQAHHGSGGQQHGGQHGGGPHQQQGQGQQQDQTEAELEKLAKKFLPRILRKLQKGCCSVM